MRFVTLFVILAFALALPCFADQDSPAVERARAELSKVQGLVGTGVLPRVRLAQAQDELADVQDDAAIRDSLYQKDITVEQADAMVALTAKRVERRQKAMDERNKFLAEGIIAKSEVSDTQASLDQAKRENGWAVTRAQLAREMVELAKNEQEIMRQLELSAAAPPSNGLVEHFVGSNNFKMSQFAGIEKAFERRFAHPLPVSAMGETEVHKTLGFDHRNRIDIALQPDVAEGKWLRGYLSSHNVPFFAFRSAVPGKATGAHIHIGPASPHYAAKLASPPSS